MDFIALAQFLIVKKFRIKITVSDLIEFDVDYAPKFIETPYLFAESHNKGVKLGFCTPNSGSTYPHIDGKIAADHFKCFDKWSKCPLCLDFPENREQAEELVNMLRFLGSKDGYTLSNTYAYLDKNPFIYGGEFK